MPVLQGLTAQVVPDLLYVNEKESLILLFVPIQSWSLCIERIHQNHLVGPVGHIPAGNQATDMAFSVEIETPRRRTIVILAGQRAAHSGLNSPGDFVRMA